MTRSPLRATALVSILFSGVAHASPTSSWTLDSYSDFDKGEANSALITSNGRIKPGYKVSALTAELEASWALVADGEDLLIGGEEGIVYRLSGDKLSNVATIPDAVAIPSLALAINGSLYVGTMPGGEVWRVDSKGNAKKLAAIAEAETVWSLAVSRDGRTLYAGTGPTGRVHRIDTASGSSKMIFDSQDKRVTSLMLASDDSVWIGTSERALVFRYDPKRNATRAIADFAGNEITAIAEWRGAAIVAANDITEPSTSGIKSKAAIDKAKKKKKEGIATKLAKKGEAPGADAATPTSAKPTRKGARKGKGALFRVHGDGRTEQLHSLSSTYFTDIEIGKDGEIFAGAGDDGRIYIIDNDDAVSVVVDVSQRVVAQMAMTPKGGLVFATADATKLYRTSPGATDSSYLSDAFDADGAAKYGAIAWFGKGATIETRSGNTAEPGLGWSSWQAPANQRVSVAGGTRGKVSSPPGRYLQLRARFSKQDDFVSRIQTYYLTDNQPTTIKSIEIKSGTDKELVTPKSAADPRKPIIELSWKVENEDKDETVYGLHVRAEGEARWRPINTGSKALTSTKFKWNTETFPDGYYRLRVTASDRLANSTARRRTTQRVSDLFAVDNEKPTLTSVSVRFPSASVQARDSLTPIAEAAFSIDDGDWHLIPAADGIYDDLSELLRIELPKDLDKGIHTLAIRAADEAGNIASLATTFELK